MKLKIIYFAVLFALAGCSDKSNENNTNYGGYTDGASTLFTKIKSAESKITFKNMIREDLEYNFLNYPYLYTGGGVAVGDLDNDGLDDIYLVSNFGSNKLYKNLGNFEFQDVTVSSKTQDVDGFSTGATLMDINNDGWKDIYVCKAGSLDSDDGRRNLLYVNQQDGTFKEEAAKWGLDDPGYTTQVYQIDYDKDGDLDLYVVNYRYDFRNNTKISSKIQSEIEEVTSDQLYRNDGSHFTKVTGEAGLYNKTWGLAGTIGDFNNDGWEDIYVSNDFLEPDHMYINMKDGTFRNEINSRIDHISFNSMGADYADLNNDLLPDLITLDMLAEDYARSKENMASMSTENFMNMVSVGYHHAYMANMLYYNKGNGKFQETGQLSGVVKTDWSWAPLIADFNNDGLKDIFVSNGVYKDYHNQDFRVDLRARNARGEAMTLDAVLALMPSEKLDNYIFQNNGDLTFSKKIEEWGLKDPNFSNGAAYADFDNDGDLDLIVNNINDEIGLYRNNANQPYIQVELKGPALNSLGLGAHVYVKSDGIIQSQQQYLTRGFESSVTNIMNFGIGNSTEIDELIVQWPDGKISSVKSPKINKRYTVEHSGAKTDELALDLFKSKKINFDAGQLGIQFVQKENDFNDFDLQLLLPQKQSTKGAAIIKGDINGDGLDDIFIGNAKGAAAATYLQGADGKFTKINGALWQSEAQYEDGNARFFDADSDGDTDLYVVSSGYEIGENNPLLQDRLYINDGLGNFSKASNALPKMLTSGKAVAAADYDKDGDVDLFVGGNVVPGKYPIPPRSYLLRNDGGKFVDITWENEILMNPGMISDAIFTDYDNDGDLDLLAVGEWMKPTFFTNVDGTFQETTNISGMDKKEGWWFSLAAADYDNDGDQDYFFGNIGSNNKFHPSEKKPLTIFAKDFDANGTFDVAMSKISNGRVVPVRGKECSSQQNPFLLDKIKSYKEFASLEFKDVYGEDRLKDAFHITVHWFKSIYVENLGDGNFKVHTLTNHAQLGPTLAFQNGDFNNDGHLDIMGIGAIYDAEVETIRYDSNYGYVLLGDGAGNFIYDSSFDPFIDSDAKSITALDIKGKEYYAVLSNNAPIEIFSFSP